MTIVLYCHHGSKQLCHSATLFPKYFHEMSFAFFENLGATYLFLIPCCCQEWWPSVHFVKSNRNCSAYELRRRQHGALPRLCRWPQTKHNSEQKRTAVVFWLLHCCAKLCSFSFNQDLFTMNTSPVLTHTHWCWRLLTLLVGLNKWS